MPAGARPVALYPTYEEAGGTLLDLACAPSEPGTNNVVPPAHAVRRIFHQLRNLESSTIPPTPKPNGSGNNIAG